MSEIRQDSLTGASVIIAANRDDRPYEFEKAAPRRVHAICPFCRGNESETPAELARYTNGQLNGASPWQVRVVPNKFPAVSVKPTNPADRRASTLPAFGSHEVIIESAEHKVSFGDLSPHEARLACLAYRDRLRAARGTAGVRFAHVFKNAGPAAGASLEHVHSQLIALSTIPSRAARMIERASSSIASSGACLFASFLEQELQCGERIIERTDEFVAFCPFAGRFPFETWIMPRENAGDYLDIEGNTLDDFADLLHRTIRRIELVSGRAAYNYSLNVRPFDQRSGTHFRWHLEMFPRLSTPAGFEWATGWFINPLAPEIGAEMLRNVPLASDATRSAGFSPENTR